MKKIQVTYKQYKTIKAAISILLLPIVVLFICVFFAIIYKGVENKEYSKFSYALFAANAILCNSLFAFGRSPIFLDRFDIPTQKLIYKSSVMFLYSTVIDFFLSGWVFANIDATLAGDGFLQKSFIGHKIILISFSIGIGISVLLSICGIIYFWKWSNRAIDKSNEEMTKELKNL